MSVTSKIEEKLRAAFSPTSLNVIDESEQHRGHGGWREGGETHFRVVMTSSALNGKSRVAQQRAIYAALKEEMAGPIHALALDVKGDSE
jgi:BolA protein